MIGLVTGGMRSGKSSFAEKRCFSATQPLYYLATAQAHDDEMNDRILHHQSQRHENWQLIEEPIKLAAILNELTTPSHVLIDCMTLWLTNCLCTEQVDWNTQKHAFLKAIHDSPHTIWIVTNEVGSGIIPMGELTRNFVDEAGWLNQAIAAMADEVHLCVSGIPIQIKPA